MLKLIQSWPKTWAKHRESKKAARERLPVTPKSKTLAMCKRVDALNKVLPANVSLSRRHHPSAGPAWHGYFAALSDPEAVRIALETDMYSGEKRLGPLIRVILDTEDGPSIQAVHEWAPRGRYDNGRTFCSRPVLFQRDTVCSETGVYYMRHADGPPKPYRSEAEWRDARAFFDGLADSRIVLEPPEGNDIKRQRGRSEPWML